MVLVPEFDHPLGISQVFFADEQRPLQDPSRQKPFSFSGIKLAPVGADGTAITQGTPLRVIFQLWEAPESPNALRGKLLHVNYLIGQLESTEKQDQQQLVDRGTFAPTGNLLMGKDLSTDTLHPGNYRLVIRATNDDLRQTAYQSLNFEIKPSSAPAASLWTVSESTAEVQNASIVLYQRGLYALANQHADLAIEYLERGIQLSPSSQDIYKALADAYRLQGNTSAALKMEQKLTDLASHNTVPSAAK